jgi:CspA family cold shock protein
LQCLDSGTFRGHSDLNSNDHPMGRGRDFRGGGTGRGRHATDEGQGFLDPPPFQAPNPPVQRSQAGDAAPVEATVKWFNPEKGFGFVEIADGSGGAFLSVRTLQAFGRDTVSPGAKLSVFVGQGEKGGQVTKIAAIDDNEKSNRTASPSRPSRLDTHLLNAEAILGKVKWFSVEKGMGFVEAEDGGKDVFVHMTVVRIAGFASLTEGQRISMRITETPKGRKAVSIEAAD